MPTTIDATSVEWVTLDEVRNHLNVTSATDDDELILVQKAAQGAVEGIIGPVLWRTITRSVLPTGTSIVLPVTPVVSVTSLLNSAGTAVTYTGDLPTGILFSVSYYGDSSLTLTYVAGRTSVGDDIRYATLIIAGHLWETQRGNGPAAGFNEETFDGSPGIGYAIPNRARDLLAPHQMLPGIA